MLQVSREPLGGEVTKQKCDVEASGYIVRNIRISQSSNA